MATMTQEHKTVTREQLVQHLNEDLAREYQAIIAYVVYSQVLKGPQYMSIAKELEKHAGEELGHALTISKHIDYLGGTATVTPPSIVNSAPVGSCALGSGAVGATAQAAAATAANAPRVRVARRVRGRRAKR